MSSLFRFYGTGFFFRLVLERKNDKRRLYRIIIYHYSRNCSMETIMYVCEKAICQCIKCLLNQITTHTRQKIPFMRSQ